MLLYLYLTAYVFTVLTAQVMADGRFLQPWTAGRRKDYSDNVNYAVGVQIITQWTADFSNAAIDLVQDNHPGLQIYLSTKKRMSNKTSGDAQGGPSVNLERMDKSYSHPTNRA